MEGRSPKKPKLVGDQLASSPPTPNEATTDGRAADRPVTNVPCTETVTIEPIHGSGLNAATTIDVSETLSVKSGKTSTGTNTPSMQSESPEFTNGASRFSSTRLSLIASKIKVCDASPMPHHRTCTLHCNEARCSGTLRRGGTCLNKASGPSDPGVMPTCKIHRGQLKVPGWCRAPLPCGFECGRRFEWKPHGFHLCSSHREDSTTCYFFKIPIEIRYRIYRFLLPDRVIPAHFVTSSDLTTDGARVYTAILRVNHQIHDEATNLLYYTREFTIEVTENTLSMCNLPNKYVQYDFSHHCGSPQCDNHARQDQIRLLLLDQQRALIARQNQSVPAHISAARFSQLLDTSHPAMSYKLVGPVWDPPLSERYFTMIQSFRIEILLSYPWGPNNTHYGPPGPSIADAEKRKALQSRLSRYCDQLHKLIGRLQLMQRPIARLEIALRFSNADVEQGEAFATATPLLNPFRRLCKVAKPQVISITVNDFQNREVELLFPGWSFSIASTTFANYLGRWSKDLSSSQLSLKCTPVLEAYWKLESLLSSIKEHCYNAEPRFCEFADLLQAARYARETNNLEWFRRIWDRVVAIWFEYLDDQKDFQSSLTGSIDAINGIVEKGS